MLEKRLIKMNTEQSDYMNQVVSSSHVMTEGLLEDVRKFVATVLRYSMGERAARQATVDVSFTTADKKQLEVTVQLPSTEAEENEQQSPVTKNSESVGRRGPPAPPPPPPPPKSNHNVDPYNDSSIRNNWDAVQHELKEKLKKKGKYVEYAMQQCMCCSRPIL